MHPRPDAWGVLAAGLAQRRPVRARYHGSERVLCPHVLGWRNSRPLVLSYQSGGTTSEGTLPSDHRQRWRLMFVDEFTEADLVDGPWGSADNYTLHSVGIDVVEFAVAPESPK